MELLVVIVILGILSAVVVFAVRGSGDKGQEAASATDKRIIRTAMETFCARYGRYADRMDELVGGPYKVRGDPASGRDGPGFISGTPTYNTEIDPAPANGNGCGGYSLGPAQNQECERLIDNVKVTVPAEPGIWCIGASPTKGVNPLNPKNMVRLPDGKIFTGMEVYDPADGPKGSWKQAPLSLYATQNAAICQAVTNYTFGSICPADSPVTMVTIGGRDPDPAKDLCGTNCGKVLAFTSLSEAVGPDGQWELYDPSSSDSSGKVGSWRPTPIRGPGQGLGGGYITRAVQILADNPLDCGLNCGKVLMINSPRPGLFELWDPKTESFTPVAGTITQANLLQALPRGQVLLMHTAPLTGSGLASIFDPITAVFVPAAPPASPHDRNSDETEMLPDGRVLVSPNYINGFRRGSTGTTKDIEIFTPSAFGVGGTWSSTKTCGEGVYTPVPFGQNPLESQCHLLSVLPGGRVLAWTGLGYDRNEPYKGRTYLWNLADGTWERTGDFNTKSEPIEPPKALPSDPEMPSGGILLSGPRCGENCGKVLAVNRRQPYRTPPRTAANQPNVVSELYTPRPPP